MPQILYKCTFTYEGFKWEQCIKFIRLSHLMSEKDKENFIRFSYIYEFKDFSSGWCYGVCKKKGKKFHPSFKVKIDVSDETEYQKHLNMQRLPMQHVNEYMDYLERQDQCAIS